VSHRLQYLVAVSLDREIDRGRMASRDKYDVMNLVGGIGCSEAPSWIDSLG
jgi:hypothetical protein